MLQICDILKLASYLKPPLNTDIFVEPDIIHSLNSDQEIGIFLNSVRIRRLRNRKQLLAQEFEKVGIEDFRLMGQSTEYLYQDTHRNPSMLFALVHYKADTNHNERDANTSAQIGLAKMSFWSH